MPWETTYDERFGDFFSLLGDFDAELELEIRQRLLPARRLAQELEDCGEYAMTRVIAKPRRRVINRPVPSFPDRGVQNTRPRRKTRVAKGKNLAPIVEEPEKEQKTEQATEGLSQTLEENVKSDPNECSHDQPGPETKSPVKSELPPEPAFIWKPDHLPHPHPILNFSVWRRLIYLISCMLSLDLLLLFPCLSLGCPLLQDRCSVDNNTEIPAKIQRSRSLLNKTMFI